MLKPALRRLTSSTRRFRAYPSTSSRFWRAIVPSPTDPGRPGRRTPVPRVFGPLASRCGAPPYRNHDSNRRRPLASQRIRRLPAQKCPSAARSRGLPHVLKGQVSRQRAEVSPPPRTYPGLTATPRVIRRMRPAHRPWPRPSPTSPRSAESPRVQPGPSAGLTPRPGSNTIPADAQPATRAIDPEPHPPGRSAAVRRSSRMRAPADRPCASPAAARRGSSRSSSDATRPSTLSLPGPRSPRSADLARMRPREPSARLRRVAGRRGP
jgi:hypothetical protein